MIVKVVRLQRSLSLDVDVVRATSVAYENTVGSLGIFPNLPFSVQFVQFTGSQRLATSLQLIMPLLEKVEPLGLANCRRLLSEKSP